MPVIRKKGTTLDTTGEAPRGETRTVRATEKMRKGRCGRVAWAMAVALLATSIAAAGAIDVRNFLSDVDEVQDKLEEVVGDVEVLASELDKKEADSALDALSDAEEEVDALSGALQRILEAEEEAEVEAADRRSSYVSPLTGQYKATMTIDLVCGMNQFKMLCGLMGLRRTYGDVRQHIWLDVRDEGPGKEDKREMWIKLGGHKPLIRQSWCGPLKFSVPTNDRWRGNQDRAKNEWTVNLTGKEPPCMSGLRVSEPIFHPASLLV